MIFIPKEIEEAVKVLEKKPEVEEPYGLAVWMKKKGYKMPKPKKSKAEEEIEKFISEVGFKDVPGKGFKDIPGKGFKDKPGKGFKDIPKKAGEEEFVSERYETNPKEPKKTPSDIYPPGGKVTLKSEEEKRMESFNHKEKSKNDSPDYKKPEIGKISKKAEIGDMGIGTLGPHEFDPREMALGMQEEKEHDDITGGDLEKTRKIVEAHLKEDPKYYTKLHSVMKAEEEHVPLRELYDFMEWMHSKGYKMDDKENFDKHMSEYDVQKFAEQKEKPAEYDAAGNPFAPPKVKSYTPPTMDKPPSTIPRTPKRKSETIPSYRPD